MILFEDLNSEFRSAVFKEPAFEKYRGSTLQPIRSTTAMGDDKTVTISKLPGLKKFSNITLKRGITDDLDLWKWRKQVMDGKIKDARKNGSIILMDDEGNDAAQWEFVAAWPTKWTGPTFNATANEVAIDTLEIAHEGLDRTK